MSLRDKPIVLAGPCRSNIRTDAELTVRNIVPLTLPEPLTRDERLRILADPTPRYSAGLAFSPGMLPKYHRNRVAGLLLFNFHSLAQQATNRETVR